MMKDEEWLAQKHSVFLSNAGLADFSERVSIKMDSEIELEEARNQAFNEFKGKKFQLHRLYK